MTTETTARTEALEALCRRLPRPGSLRDGCLPVPVDLLGRIAAALDAPVPASAAAAARRLLELADLLAPGPAHPGGCYPPHTSCDGLCADAKHLADELAALRRALAPVVGAAGA